jgi:hypothetical protein
MASSAARVVGRLLSCVALSPVPVVLSISMRCVLPAAGEGVGDTPHSRSPSDGGGLGSGGTTCTLLPVHPTSLAMVPPKPVLLLLLVRTMGRNSSAELLFRPASKGAARLQSRQLVKSYGTI